MKLINFTNTSTQSKELTVEDHDKIMDVINVCCYDKFNSFTKKYLLDLGKTDFYCFWERMNKRKIFDKQLLSLGMILECFEQPMNPYMTRIPFPCGVLLDKHLYQDKVLFIKSLANTLKDDAITFTLNASEIVNNDIDQVTSILFEFAFAVLSAAQNKRVILLIKDIDMLTVEPEDEPNEHLAEISRTFMMIYSLLFKNIKDIILFGFYNNLDNICYDFNVTFDYLISEEED